MTARPRGYYALDSLRPRVPRGEMLAHLHRYIPGAMESYCEFGHIVTITSSHDGWSALCSCGAAGTGTLLSRALLLTHTDSVVAPA